MLSPQLQPEFMSVGAPMIAPVPENNVVHLPIVEEAYVSLPERGVSQPYLRWVEACARDPDLGRSLQKHLDDRLDSLGCKIKNQPDGDDAEGVYLLKASLKYAEYCSIVEEPRNFRSWVMREGVAWERHDAKTQTLNKALNHVYTSASAKADGQRVMTQVEAIQFSQRQAVQYGAPHQP